MIYALVNNSKIENMMKYENEDDFQLFLQSFPSALIPGQWIKLTENNRTNDMDAGVGWLYDYTSDKFYPPQPFPSWKLDENYVWKSPIENYNEMPIWDENLQYWHDCVNCNL